MSELPADSHEDDNSCTAADAQGPVPLPFRDNTLAIENPHDVDWFLFNLAAPAVVTARVAPLPSTTADSLKDLDLYVVKKPPSGATGALQIMGADTSAADTGAVVVALGAGQYYAVVIDFAGTSTPYTMCIDPSLTPCAGFPPAPPRAVTPQRPPAAPFPARLVRTPRTARPRQLQLLLPSGSR